VVFGLREIGTVGTQFLINDRKTFFRGTWNAAFFRRRVIRRRMSSPGGGSCASARNTG